MLVNINKEEAQKVVNLRAWSRLFNTKGKKVDWLFFSVMAPPVIVVFSGTIMLINNGSNTIPSIFMAIGLLGCPFMLKTLRKFKKLQIDIMEEIIKEEHKEYKEVQK